MELIMIDITIKVTRWDEGYTCEHIPIFNIGILVLCDSGTNGFSDGGGRFHFKGLPKVDTPLDFFIKNVYPVFIVNSEYLHYKSTLRFSLKVITVPQIFHQRLFIIVTTISDWDLNPRSLSLEANSLLTTHSPTIYIISTSVCFVLVIDLIVKYL